MGLLAILCGVYLILDLLGIIRLITKFVFKILRIGAVVMIVFGLIQYNKSSSEKDTAVVDSFQEAKQALEQLDLGKGVEDVIQ